MLKKLLLTAGGIALSGACVIFLYLALLSLNDEGNIFLFLASFLSCGSAVYLFIRATKDPKQTASIIIPPSQITNQTPLEKNNKLDSEWDNTNKAREKLKMLEISASAAAQPEE